VVAAPARASSDPTGGPTMDDGTTTNTTLGRRPGLGAPLASLPSTAISRLADDSRDWVASWNDPPEVSLAGRFSGGQPVGGPSTSEPSNGQAAESGRPTLAFTVVSRAQADRTPSPPVLPVVSRLAVAERTPELASGDHGSSVNFGLDADGAFSQGEVGDRPLVGERAISASGDGSMLPGSLFPASTEGQPGSLSNSTPVPLLRTVDGPSSLPRQGSPALFSPSSAPRATKKTATTTISRRFDASAPMPELAVGGRTSAGTFESSRSADVLSRSTVFRTAESTVDAGRGHSEPPHIDSTPSGSVLRTVPTLPEVGAAGTTLESVTRPSLPTLRRQSAGSEHTAGRGRDANAAWEERSSTDSSAGSGTGVDADQHAYQTEGAMVPASVQREPDADAPAPAPAQTVETATTPPAPPATGSTAQAEADIEALAGRLYERLRSRLRRELLDDRERAGLVLDRVR
jgi:hypothetical protein